MNEGGLGEQTRRNRVPLMMTTSFLTRSIGSLKTGLKTRRIKGDRRIQNPLEARLLRKGQLRIVLIRTKGGRGRIERGKERGRDTKLRRRKRAKCSIMKEPQGRRGLKLNSEKKRKRDQRQSILKTLEEGRSSPEKTDMSLNREGRLFRLT